ncbi:hypothetical protein IFM89_024089 [Coptis chinensis]|uniref:Uncharacterized protein n=1 Tax=Coptis chinensis TaxID=261450 RepID=A0A835HZL5_9MAGN|nr:hypothetical protein IFM89_024089 [Coptis chinensis]
MEFSIVHEIHTILSSKRTNVLDGCVKVNTRSRVLLLLDKDEFSVEKSGRQWDFDWFDMAKVHLEPTLPRTVIVPEYELPFKRPKDWEPRSMEINAINATTEAACLILSVGRDREEPKGKVFSASCMAFVVLSIKHVTLAPKVGVFISQEFRRRVHKEMLLLERWVEGVAGQVSVAVERECEGVELFGFEDAKDFLE